MTDAISSPGVPPTGTQADRGSPGCRWCGAPLVDPRESGATFHVVRCPRCASGTTLPYPSDDTLERAYSEWYRPRDGRFGGGGDLILRGLRGRVARWIDGSSPPGPVLDVGCGDGSMLDALHARGRAAFGLERHADRPDVRDETLSECGDGWAAIIFWHSLEHLPAPRQAINDAAGRLAPGGKLVVAVPNWSSWQARAFGDRWFHLDLPRHLTHLTSENLRAACLEEGLTGVRVSYARGGQVAFGWLHGLVGLVPGHLNLYMAIRRGEAQEARSGGSRAAALTAAAVMSPLALVGAACEMACRRSGTVCLVAARPGRS